MPKGIIYIATASKEDFIELRIRNTDSFIPEEELGQLFDAFYTRNKKGGTGLGLAIAKKIVIAHRGEIWCKSSKEIGVEFGFTLPSVI